MKYNNDVIQGIEDDINLRKKDLKNFQKSKKVFLLEILKYGLDCRFFIITDLQIFDNYINLDLQDYLGV